MDEETKTINFYKLFNTLIPWHACLKLTNTDIKAAKTCFEEYAKKLEENIEHKKYTPQEEQDIWRTIKKIREDNNLTDFLTHAAALDKTLNEQIGLHSKGSLSPSEKTLKQEFNIL